jgi:hypothetical protein
MAVVGRGGVDDVRNSRPGTSRSSAFATVGLPTAGEPWRKSSFMPISIANRSIRGNRYLWRHEANCRIADI